MTNVTAVQEIIADEENRYESDVVDNTAVQDDSYPIDQFELVSSPNDWNVTTLVNYIDRGVVLIPGFQRNFVWDIARASRLVESIIVGFPVPQIFLYEKAPNKFLVIDGQQRLRSIYYFSKQRFPRKEKLAELTFATYGESKVPDELLEDDSFFTDFTLYLPETTPGIPNRFNRRRYSTLDEDHQLRFDLRTIRNVIVQQISPSGDGAMYEIFNRLNSGGINLRPQEIRRCMFDSKFYDMLYRTNVQQEWRSLVGTRIPDIHMKDVEILLRGFAMLISGDKYRPSMVKFLNRFSVDARAFDDVYLERLRQLLESFLVACRHLPSTAFHSTQGRFSPMIFEAVFVAACAGPFENGLTVADRVMEDSLVALKKDLAFASATQSRTTHPDNVRIRLERAKEIIVVGN